jgi:DNA polymerase
MSNETIQFGRSGVLSVEGEKGIRLPNGLYLKYPNLRKLSRDGQVEYVYDTKKGKAVVPNKIYGGKVVENICQALARIVIGEQLLRVASKYQVVLTVHDAICALVPESEQVVGQNFVESCMRERPTWAPDLPLNCESGMAVRYGDC